MEGFQSQGGTRPTQKKQKPTFNPGLPLLEFDYNGTKRFFEDSKSHWGVVSDLGRDCPR
jgi:hypothetical protein